jgi:hypothetical protein
MGRLAGAIALQIGRRPTELLGMSESPYEDLLLDSAILSKVIPKSKEDMSLADEIREKRRKLAYRYIR